MKIKFTKMQGLGNDFVIIDATEQAFQMTKSQIQKMANRRLGVGFDQLLVIEPQTRAETDFNFRIFNADGGEVGQCGNGARCIAHFIRRKKLSQRNELRLSVLNDVLQLTIRPDDKVSVRMGIPQFEPQKIPFLAPKEQHYYEIELEKERIRLSIVNVGNPHAVIQVPKLEASEVGRVGARLSVDEKFPEGVNVGFMQVIDPQNICLRVYERGTGETLACGSGACAAMVIGRRNGLLQERVTVNQPGGALLIDWQGPNTPIYMTGPATHVYEGEWYL